jgi:hypothetical protein
MVGEKASAVLALSGREPYPADLRAGRTSVTRPH